MNLARCWTLAVFCGLAIMAPAAGSADPVQIALDGVRLNGEMTVPEGASVADGVVLITHGTLAHKDMETVVTLRNALSEHGIASLAISLGYGIDAREGMYDCANGANRHRHEDALDEIGAWLEWLKGQGAERIALMGHSRGGNQTAWFAAERDDPTIRAILLLAPGTSQYEAAAAGFMRRFKRDLGALLDEARSLPPDSLMEGIPFLQDRCSEALVSAGSFISYYADEPRRDTPTLLPRINKPVLIIAGSEDTVVPGLEGRVAPYLNDNVRFAMVDGADHFFLDLFMEDVADAVVAFLGERL